MLYFIHQRRPNKCEPTTANPAADSSFEAILYSELEEPVRAQVDVRFEESRLPWAIRHDVCLATMHLLGRFGLLDGSTAVILARNFTEGPCGGKDKINHLQTFARLYVGKPTTSQAKTFEETGVCHLALLVGYVRQAG